MRAVRDTNVFVSGLLLPASVPGQIVSALRRGDFRLATSEPMLVEFGAVVAYPKLQKRIGWDAETIARYLMLLRFEADVADIHDESALVPRDPADAMVLPTLLAGGADFLVSGDQDLLALAMQYPIITPTEFVSRIF
ncbi:MAG: putative toxin-antitoxin system toxin component, PIN family [Rhodocyclales bacterium]|nr:putative toxin-antitoxin system toxin component, PIN family [Rhodocyclales bacterium]